MTLKTVKLASTKYYDHLPVKGNAYGQAFRDVELEQQVRAMCYVILFMIHTCTCACYKNLSILFNLLYYNKCILLFSCIYIGPRDDPENGHRRPIRRQVFLPRCACDTLTSAWRQLSGGPGGVVLG